MGTCPQCRVAHPDELTHCPSDGAALLPPEVFTPERDLQPGDTVGEFKVEGLLGKGGFGAVFRAVQPLIGKQVAIKVLSRQFSANPEIVSRFISEARAVNQIRHQNIIDIFSFGKLPDGRQYYVMELCAGVTLAGELKRRPHHRLPLAEAVPILKLIARALDAAHAKGIAHRDLKPDNVFLADDDGRPFPKLLDFGIAKLLAADDAHQHKTATGTPMGTPAYMSPEQCRGRAVDHRTDVYSFGVMTYQVLTGRLPFTGDDAMDIIMKQLSTEPTPPSQFVDLPPQVDAAVLAMLAKDPARRPLPLATAVQTLEDAVGQPVSHRTPALSDTLAPDSVELASAPTISAPATHPSFVAAESQATLRNPAPRRRGRYLVALGALALTGLGLWFLRDRSSSPPSAAAPGPSVPVPGPSVPVPGPSVPVPVPAPAPVPVPVPAPAAATITTVTVQIVGPSAGTQVYDSAHTLLGPAPGPLTLPRGDQPVELFLEHSKYQPLRVAYTPLADGELRVVMRKRLPKPPGPDGKKPPTPDLPEF